MINWNKFAPSVIWTMGNKCYPLKLPPQHLCRQYGFIQIKQFNSSADCARELLKPLKEQVWVCSEKELFFFVSAIMSGVVLDLFGPLHLALGLNR